MLAKLQRFLNKHCDFTRPILIAVSGGPDSIALLHLMLELSKTCPLKMGIAHVDHRWRKESQEEARILEQLAAQLNVPYHLKVLNPELLEGNLENACRQQRYTFFEELIAQHGYQAVMTGHHQDDLSETILKRIFEGASLTSLKGIQSATEIFDIPVWRPLLEVNKKEILDWLSKAHLSFFEDRTNIDTRFLRGRMRTSIMPDLAKQFGKEIQSTLVHLSQESDELDCFLRKHLERYKVKDSPLGLWLDLSEQMPDSIFELKYLLRTFFKQQQLSLSRAQLETAVQLVKEAKGNKCLQIHKQNIYFDRSRVFIERVSLLETHPQIILDESLTHYANWKISWDWMDAATNSCSNWKDVWKGKFFVVLPKGDYQLCAPAVHNAYPRTSSLDKWWTAHKVPAFLRSKVPVVWSGNQIVHEFLSGKMYAFRGKVEQWAKVTFEYT